MFIVTFRKLFYTISGVLVIASLAAIFTWGLKLGIDFTGGTSVQFDYQHGRPSLDIVSAEINSLQFTPAIQGEYTLVPTGDAGYTLSLRTITDDERSQLSAALTATSSGNPAEIKEFNSIGPILGQEAESKSLISIILVILCIVLYITFAFRKVSEPVSSFKYGIISIIALLHDIIIPTGVFVVLGHYFPGYEIGTLFVTAILVILGFSIHDTIVVFDRVRENLKLNRGEKNSKSFEQVVGASISQTFVRSINTSLTTLLAILVVYLLGPAATKDFALTLLVGIFAGTYSSIFIGSNLLVTVEKRKAKKALSTARK
jgi:preprotein translocase subunit SecF